MKVGSNPPIPPGDEDPLLGKVDKKAILKLVEEIESHTLLPKTNDQFDIKEFYRNHLEEVLHNFEVIKEAYAKLIPLIKRPGRGAGVENLNTMIKKIDDLVARCKQAGSPDDHLLWEVYQMNYSQISVQTAATREYDL